MCWTRSPMPEDSGTFRARIHQDSKRFEFFLGSVTSIEMVNSLVQKSDVVVHFAAETHVTRSILESRRFFETDILGTHTVTNAVLKFMDSVERFIHISTSEIYGTALREPMDEDHPLNPCSPYASAKCGADRLVLVLLSYLRHSRDYPQTLQSVWTAPTSREGGASLHHLGDK